MRKAITIAFLLFLFTLVSADRLSLENCPGLVPADRVDSCDDIPSDIPLEQQKEIVLALMYDYYGYPDYAFMKVWNTEPEFRDPPAEATLTSSHDTFGSGPFSVIQDAWVVIAAINPSLEEEGDMLAPARGEVQTEYNYKVQPPPDGEGSGVCEYSYIYSLGPVSTNLKVQLNGQTLWDGAPEGHRLVEYSSSEDMDFKSTVTVSTTVTEEVWETVCKPVPCGGEEGGTCCDFVCEKVGENTYYPSVTVDDTVFRQLHQYSYYISYLMDGDDLIVVDLFSTNPLNSYHIYFNGAEFEKTKFDYSVGFSAAPYDVLHAKASYYENAHGHNLYLGEDTNEISLTAARQLIEHLGSNEQSEEFLGLAHENGWPIYHSQFKLSFDPALLENLDKCEMEIWSHFERIELKDLCSKKVLPGTEIQLDVNNYYFKGEEIKGDFNVVSGGLPFNGQVLVSFQGEELQVPFFNGQGQFSFEAGEGGILTLSFPTDLKHASQSINKKIFVQDESVVWGLFDLFLFFAGWIFVFILLKKVMGKWFK